MDQNGIFMADFMLELPDGFQKGLAFNIPYRAPYLNNGDMGFLRGKVPVKTAFYFVGDMRDYLDRAAAVISRRSFCKTDQYTFPVVTLEFLLKFSSIKRS